MQYWTYGCLINTSFNETITAPQRYLGGTTHEQKFKADISVLIKTDTEYKDFLDWYFNGINNGGDSFYLKYSFWGIERFWIVKITGDISVSIDKNKEVRTLKVPITFQEDISTIV